MNDLRVVIHQTAPLLGEVEANGAEVRRLAEESAAADLVVFPELALSGYSLRSRAQRVVPPSGQLLPPGLLPPDPAVALTVLERGEDELLYNTGVLARGDRSLIRYRKIYLPTYGPFDEGRYFAPGREPPPVATLPSGWRVGLLICEDFWHPALLYLLAMQGAEVVVVMSAAVGRGEPRDGPAGGGPLFSSTGTWEVLAMTAALQYGVFVVLAVRAGVEEGMTFAGGSCVVGPGGEILARAPQGEPATLEAVLSRAALRAGRTPFSHLRDEDPGFLRRSLERLEREGRISSGS